jgi:hypothetical protein
MRVNWFMCVCVCVCVWATREMSSYDEPCKAIYGMMSHGRGNVKSISTCIHIHKHTGKRACQIQREMRSHGPLMM